MKNKRYLFRLIASVLHRSLTLIFLLGITIRSENLFALDSETKSKSKKAIEIVRAEEAEYITVKESKEGILIFRGGIIIRIGKQELRADIVKLNPESGEIYAEGNITLSDGLQSVTGDSFVYDNRQKQGVLFNSRVTMRPVYFVGEKVRQVSAKNFILTAAFFTSCEAINPHYYFKASKIWLYDDNQIVASNIVYYVGDTPLFYLPFLLKTDIGTGVISHYGYNRNRGHFTQNTYYLGIGSDDKRAYVPNSAKIMLDYYQKLGLFFGTRLKKNKGWLSYDLEAGVADYKVRDEVVLPGESSSRVTNQLLRPDGSCCVESHEFWWKVKSDIRADWRNSNRDDIFSSLYVKFDNYRNQDFDREFNQRFEPENTFEAISPGRIFNGNYGINSLFWEVAYEENWLDNHFNVKVSRNLVWDYNIDPNNSKYQPVYDLAPSMGFSKKVQIIDGNDRWFGGAWGSMDLGGNVNRYYTDGELIKTIFSGDGKGDIKLYFPFYRWLSLVPSGGYGIIHQFARQQDVALGKEVGRASYQYVFTEEKLRLGLPEFHLLTSYYIQYAFEQEVPDPTLRNQREHFTRFALISDMSPGAYISLSAARDLRDYKDTLTEAERWYPFEWETQIDYDFINGFGGRTFGMPSRKRHFMGIGFKNNYNYLIRFNTQGSNDLFSYFQFGGYRLAFFRELVKFRTGLTWHNDFIDMRQSELLFSWEMDLLLHRFWRLFIGSNSRANEMERYQSSSARQVSFFEDLKNGLNFTDANARKNAVFNMDSFFVMLEHNLHRWVMRLSYNIAKRTFYFGEGRRNQASYYEQTVYFSMQLTDFGGLGVPESQVYRDNPSDNFY